MVALAAGLAAAGLAAAGLAAAGLAAAGFFSAGFLAGAAFFAEVSFFSDEDEAAGAAFFSPKIQSKNKILHVRVLFSPS